MTDDPGPTFSFPWLLTIRFKPKNTGKKCSCFEGKNEQNVLTVVYREDPFLLAYWLGSVEFLAPLTVLVPGGKSLIDRISDMAFLLST